MNNYYKVDEYLKELKSAIVKHKSADLFMNQLILSRLGGDCFYKHFAKPYSLLIGDENPSLAKQEIIFTKVISELDALQKKYKNTKLSLFTAMLEVSVPLSKNPELKNEKVQKDFEEVLRLEFDINFIDKVLNSKKVVPQNPIDRVGVRVSVSDDGQKLNFVVMVCWVGFSSPVYLAEIRRIRQKFETHITKKLVGAKVIRKKVYSRPTSLGNELLQPNSRLVQGFEAIKKRNL